MRERIRNILMEATAFEDRPNINDNFWKWFGDSKVVDEQGDPLIVYHGTSRKFSIFDKSKTGMDSGNMGFLGKGFYFTEEKSIASAYGDVMPVFLRIENPLLLTGDLSEEEADVLNDALDTFVFDEGMSPSSVFDGLVETFTTLPEWSQIFSDNLQNAGYDGLIFKTINRHGDKKNEIVVYDSNQIKSIFNQGTWNSNNPDITK